MAATLFISIMLGAYTSLFIKVGEHGYAIDEIVILILLGAGLLHILFVPDSKSRNNKGKPPLNSRTNVVFADGDILSNAKTSKLDWSLSAQRPIASFLPKALISF